MYIKELSAENIGPIDQLHMNFYKDRVHIVSGDHGSGKTYLFKSIQSLFTGEDFSPIPRIPSIQSKIEVIFDFNGKEITVNGTQCETKADIAVKRCRENIIFIDGEQIGDDRTLTPNSFEKIKNFLQDVSNQICGELSKRLSSRITFLCERKCLSAGDQAFVSIMKQLSQCEPNMILVADDLVSRCNEKTASLVFDLLNSLNDIQIILFLDNRTVQSCQAYILRQKSLKSINDCLQCLEE